jgi:ribosomal protein S1
LATKKSKTSTSKTSSAKKAGSLTMAELLAKSSNPVRGLKKLERIDATFREIDGNKAIFDIGGKSEGVIQDLAFAEARDFLRMLKPGDSVRALVLDPENREGNAVLSVRHAVREQFWGALEEAYERGTAVSVVGKSVSEKGVMVLVDAVTAFIPRSQLGEKALKNPERLVEKTFKVKILDLDREKNRIVLSEKAVSEAESIAASKKAMKEVEEGDMYKGIVTTIVPFGAFVEIAVPVGESDQTVSVEGLVHVSEISWAKVHHPSEMLSEGDKVKVVVLGSDDNKLAFSMRRALEDPWTKVVDEFDVDDRVTGKVVRTSDFGVFVELKPGVEGLIHITKIPPGSSFAKGDSVSCYIEDINIDERRIGLGIAVTTSKPIGYK